MYNLQDLYLYKIYIIEKTHHNINSFYSRAVSNSQLEQSLGVMATHIGKKIIIDIANKLPWD